MQKRTDRSFGDRQGELVDILPNLRRFAVSLTGQLADADDLLQATIERLLSRGLPDDARLLPWCLRVCRNLWTDELRARRVRRKVDDDPETMAEYSISGEQVAHGEISLAEVQAILAGIPVDQRVVLELVAVEGLSYKEAAEVLGIPTGTVMSRLARARANLVDRRDGETIDEVKGRTQ